jgi:RimJ/RimL family protein N-acetyltransferase
MIRLVDQGRQEEILSFVRSVNGGDQNGGNATAIGLERNGRLVVGVVYDQFNGANVCMHISAEPGRHWLNRLFLWAMFDYPFNVLNVKRVTGQICSSNTDSIRFAEHIGFTYETRIKDASPNGDLLIYALFKNQCRYI